MLIRMYLNQYIYITIRAPARIVTLTDLSSVYLPREGSLTVRPCRAWSSNRLVRSPSFGELDCVSALFGAKDWRMRRKVRG